MNVAKYKINKGFITQKLDDKTAIFDGEESLRYTFNETASFIFQKLKIGWEEERIVGVLAKKYGIKPKKAQDDLNGLLKDLLRKKIITQKTE